MKFRTYHLAVEFYRLTKTLHLPYAPKDQLNRAALSIALNLAEGRGKRTTKDQLRFFHIALGSLRECQAILELESLTESEQWQLADKLGASLFRLIQNAR